MHRKNALGYGVMVTLQILVLPFLVRVRVAQQKKSRFLTALFLFLFLVDFQISYFVKNIFSFLLKNFNIIKNAVNKAVATLG